MVDDVFLRHGSYENGDATFTRCAEWKDELPHAMGIHVAAAECHNELVVDSRRETLTLVILMLQESADNVRGNPERVQGANGTRTARDPREGYMWALEQT